MLINFNKFLTNFVWWYNIYMLSCVWFGVNPWALSLKIIQVKTKLK